jgi:Holliday junction resolvase-like predicted endonuclease
MAGERPRAGPLQAPRQVARDAPSPERQVAFRTGISAESRAAAFLIAKGFRILARRWRSPVGEIDIIARRRSLLIFVEVKARANLDDAAWSVTERQRLRIAAAAERATGMPASATSASMQCWWRRDAFRAISLRRSTPAASVPIPKFASLCGTLVCELRNRRTLATY